MKSGDEILMGKIMKVVNEHLDDPALNVEMLASEVGLSRVHVHRKLKELTNFPLAILLRTSVCNRRNFIGARP